MPVSVFYKVLADYTIFRIPKFFATAARFFDEFQLTFIEKTPVISSLSAGRVL